MKSDRLKVAWVMGQVEKYAIDLGWKENIWVFVIYEKSGGTKEAYAVAEAIMETNEEEVDADPRMPTLVMGDFNAAPCKLQSVKKLIEEQS